MKVTHKLIIGMMILSSYCEALTFNDLKRDTIQEETKGSIIQLRGFLYETPAGEWILSPEPSLKSCCRGSADKGKYQVLLIGDEPFTKTDRVVTIEGVLQKSDPPFYYKIVESKFVR